MKSLTKYGTIMLLVVLVARWLGWSDSWYLVAGGVSVGVPLALLLVWRLIRPARRSTPAEDDVVAIDGLDDEVPGIGGARDAPAARESAVVGALQGLALGVALVVYLAVAFSVLKQAPWTYDRYYDSDRGTLEAMLTALEAAGNYREATNTIDERLGRPIGSGWRRSLVQRQYADLVQLAQREVAEQRIPLLRKARTLAADHKLDDTAARALEEQASRELSLNGRLVELRDSGQWTGVVDVLRSELLRDVDSTAAARRLHDAYCEAAAHAASVEERGRLYEQAADLAGRYRIPGDRARSALRENAEIQAARGEEQQKQQLLEQFVQEAAATRRELIEAMLDGALRYPSPELRLLELKRVAELAEIHNVQLQSLNPQITALEQALASEDEFSERVGRLRREGKYEQAIAELVPAVGSSGGQRWPRPLDAELLDCLDEWTSAIDGSPLEARRDRLQQALTIAHDCGLDPGGLSPRLADIQQAIAEVELRLRSRADDERRRNAPAELPAGATTRIARTSAIEFPFLVLDVLVKDEQGTPIVDLEPKDFQVALNGDEVPFLVQPACLEPLAQHVVFLIDRSASVSPALDSLKSAVADAARHLSQGRAFMTLISFGATVNTEVPWTTEAAAISSGVEALRVNGSTALLKALQVSCGELARLPADRERVILLFSDGADSVGGASLADVTRELDAGRIKVYAIGLKTKELDPASLRRVAASGQYVEAGDTADLVQRFSQASRAIRRDGYRLVADLGTKTAVGGRVSVAVGRGGAAAAIANLEEEK